MSNIVAPGLWHFAGDALRNLKAHGQRTYLAISGIAIGCSAIIALLNIGHNAALESMRMFDGMGSTTVLATFPSTSEGKKPIPASPVFNFNRSDLNFIIDFSRVSQFSTRVRNGKKTADVTISGVDESLLRILDSSVATGRFITRYDAISTFVVLGSKVAAELGTRVGDSIQIGGYLYTVVGILTPKPPAGLIPLALNDAVLMPMSSMQRVYPDPSLSFVVGRTRTQEDLDKGAREFKSALEIVSHGSNVQVQIPSYLLDGIARQNRTSTYLLAALGTVSLLVGGIGVMNVMLMNISERKREIGLRIALGARAVDIRNLFLAEAVILSTIGAAVGSAVGLLAGYVFITWSGWSFELSPVSLPMGIACSLVTGIFFGLHPALAAAKLRPVEALRDE